VPVPPPFRPPLAVSGLPTDAFYFGGFLPAKQGARRRVLESLVALQSVLVFYEAPHRIVQSLETVAELFGDRQLVIGRELTKLHEEVWRGTAVGALGEWRSRPQNKGELVLLIGKPVEATAVGFSSARDAFNRHLAAGLPRMDAIKAAARECGFSKRDLYKLLEEE
jgi:16S rRNA (cytidine1402-2'-O)-methyltransferase